MTKAVKLHAHLVAVSIQREAVRIYAVLAATAPDALMAASIGAPPRSKVQIVGSLSRDLVKRLRLKPGEMRLV